METTVLYGNGVNLLANKGVSWDCLLESISEEKRLLSIPSYTLKYESIVLPTDEITPAVLRDRYGRRFISSDGKVIHTSENTEIYAIKGKICNILDDIEPSNYYQKLIDLNADHYLTTNYELYLVQLLLSRGYTAKSISDSDSALYKHFILQKEEKKTTVWNIHGDMSDPKSIIIGYADYSNYTNKVHRLLETKRGLKKSWVSLLFNTNVHIVGYGLADDEMDMWDILVNRARIIRHTGKQKNQIYYYLINKGKGVKSKKMLLERLKVSVVEIPYEGSYLSSYQDIYNRIKEKMITQK